MSTQDNARVSLARATFSRDRRILKTQPEDARRPRVARQLVATLRPGAFVRNLRTFYSDRVAWPGTVAIVAVLVYGGGAAMFWYHSIYLGEGGPPISPWLHWILDSTAGLLGLTVPILLILPLAAATGTAGGATVRSGPFAAITGTLLATVTAPGPFVHDALVGRGTWLAARVTHWFGTGHEPTGRPPDLSIPLRMLQQIAFGIPLYAVLAWVTLGLIRWTAALRH